MKMILGQCIIKYMVEIASLEKHLNVLNIDEILSIMKFPKEWKKIKSPKSTWDI